LKTLVNVACKLLANGPSVVHVRDHARVLLDRGEGVRDDLVRHGALAKVVKLIVVDLDNVDLVLGGDLKVADKHPQCLISRPI